ncbi:MAG: branched-chain amino acid ABC transporter permease [Coriobacteriales bacterium]|nr:branched-chain amino acid ABC transporter permease [Coriobacteriales bacterium]
MSTTIFAEFLINTLSLGSLYALISLGLVFVYGIMQLVNFAYGEFITVSCYTLYMLGAFTDLPWPLVFLCAILTGVLIGYLSELVAFRPFRGRSLDALLVTSFAISVILQHVFQLAISPRSKAVPLPEFFNYNVELFGVVTPLRSYIIIVTTVILLIGFTFLMRKTVLGVAMRAASENFVAARLMGVPANLVISTAFIISGLLAGIVAIFWSARAGTVEPLMGGAPLLVGFIAVVIGGMHSIPGSVVGGFVYAVIANVLALALPTTMLSFRDAIMFAIVILFLVLKPEGLIRGSYQEERVG